MIERASKFTTAASTLLIVVLLLWLHPDITLPLQITGAVVFLVAAFVFDPRLAWRGAERVGSAGSARQDGPAGRRDRVLQACLLAAPLAPAVLWLATSREQPVVDIVWMAALAGALLRTVSWSAWSLPPLWQPLAGGWALTLALAWPVLVARETSFDLAGVRDWGAVVSWAFWPAPYAVSWILYWVLTQLLALLWLDWIASRFIAQPERLPGAAHALWIGTTAASVVAIIQGTIDLTFLNPPFWSSLFRATGTMLEANGYAHAAAIGGPVAFVALRIVHPHAPAWAWAALVVNWLGLWMSGSQTGALLCGVAGAAGLLAGLWRTDAIGSRRQVFTAAALVVPAAAILILIGDASGPLQRVAQTVRDRPHVRELLWDRGGYGSSAVQMLSEYPLTGTGAGSYHFLAPDYVRASADDALAPDNAQNWWRHQAAELGALGGALVLTWSVVLAWQVLSGRSLSASRSGPRALAEPTVRGLLVGIGLSSMIGMPTQNPVVLIWFFLLVGWLGVLVEAPRPFGTPSARASRGLWILAAVLAVSYAGGHLLLARTSLSVAARASRFDREYVTGAYQPEALADGTEFRWTDDQSRFVLPVSTPWLVVKLWAGHPDIATSPVEVSLSTPCGVLWNEPLSSPQPVTIGVILPEGLRSVDATVGVGRTWQPSAYGSGDRRELGVGVSMAFAGSVEGAEEQTYALRWPTCQPPGD